MEQQHIKAPSQWLAISISATALFCFIFWAYIQMRHWKEPEADYVAIAGNIAFTLIVLGVFIVAIFINVRDARRARSLRAQIVSIKDDYELRLKKQDGPTKLSEQPLNAENIRLTDRVYQLSAELAQSNAALTALQARYEESIRSSSVWENRCGDARTQLAQMQQHVSCVFEETAFRPQLGGGESILLQYIFIKLTLTNPSDSMVTIMRWKLAAGNVIGEAQQIPNEVALLYKAPKLSGMEYKEGDVVEEWEDIRRTSIRPRSYRTGWLMFTINGFLTDYEDAEWILSCVDQSGTGMEFKRPAGSWPRRFTVHVISSETHSSYHVSQAVGGAAWLNRHGLS